MVIHNDITTADGEFEIFQNITAADVQRVARTYFTAENRLVLTLMPSARRGERAGGPMTRPTALATSCCSPLARGDAVAQAPARPAATAAPPGRRKGRRVRWRRAT